MARDYLSLGSTPADENCAQVGESDYHERTQQEGRAYIAQLRRQFGEEPYGCRFKLKAFPHDFGTYHEVCIEYLDDVPESVEYAFKVDNECPAAWDSEARIELGLD